MTEYTQLAAALGITPTIAGWLGFAFGAPGALLLALNVAWSGWGWWAFLASNIAWITFALLTGEASLLLQQLVFMGTTLVGLWRWSGCSRQRLSK